MRMTLDADGSLVTVAHAETEVGMNIELSSTRAAHISYTTSASVDNAYVGGDESTDVIVDVDEQGRPFPCDLAAATRDVSAAWTASRRRSRSAASGRSIRRWPTRSWSHCVSAKFPDVGLDIISTGIDEHLAAFEREFPRIESGAGRIRFLRGDFGTGKTFFLKALAARAHEAGLATAYVRISYPDVALKPLALYATIARTLRTRRQPKGFFRAAIDRWVHRAAERASDPTIGTGVSEMSPDFGNAVETQLRVMLGDLFDRAPSFAQALAGYARALDEDRIDVSRGCCSGSPAMLTLPLTLRSTLICVARFVRTTRCQCLLASSPFSNRLAFAG